MNLYVFPEFCPDYSFGLAFTFAESEEEAKAKIMDGFGSWDDEDWDDLDIFPTFGKVVVYPPEEFLEVVYARSGGA